jgi:hypothetical protein
MRIKKLLIMSMLAVALLGCGKHQTRHIVILQDVSGSIDRESLEQAFQAIDGLAGHLQRGDRLTIIPILGDAEADAPGRIIRLEMPKQRRAYDTDLGKLKHTLQVALSHMHGNAVAHPGSKTDIFGSVELAEQEFRRGPAGLKRELIIFSDFIQEDSETDFRTDTRLLLPAMPMRVAQETAQGHLDFRDTRVYLGLLRSHEYARLKTSRRAALKAFWLGYFKSLGARPEFSSDAGGLLTSLQSK